jgi:hypothetical protein
MIMIDSAIETGQLLATSVEIMSKTAALKTLGCPATKLANSEYGKKNRCILKPTWAGIYRQYEIA